MAALQKGVVAMNKNFKLIIKHGCFALIEFFITLEIALKIKYNKLIRRVICVVD